MEPSTEQGRGGGCGASLPLCVCVDLPRWSGQLFPLWARTGGLLPRGACFSPGLRKAGCPRRGLRVDRGLESRNGVGLGERGVGRLGLGGCL